MTKIVNKYAIAIGGIFLIACGLFPKLAALISIMPDSVLGGAAVMMFSSIVVSGIQLVTREPITARSVTILSVALGLGYGMGANADILKHVYCCKWYTACDKRTDYSKKRNNSFGCPWFGLWYGRKCGYFETSSGAD